MGLALEEQGRAAEAADEYARAIELDPNTPVPHYQWASLLLRQGQNTEAIDHFRIAIAIDPTDAMAYCGLAIALGQSSRVDQAIAECQRALRIEPTTRSPASFWPIFGPPRRARPLGKVRGRAVA